jgi:aspartate/methionine/tyrosine aminotransferase
MPIPDFAIERYFQEHEFTARHLLSSSDAETISMAELVASADEEAAALWRDLRLGYTEVAGHPLLRAAIAASYRGVEAEDVLVFSGAEEPILAIGMALVSPGDHVVCLTPCYQSLHEVARSAGAEVTLVPLSSGAGRWRLDLDALRAAIRPGTTRLVVVNVPNNPTGWLPDPGTWATIVAITEAAGARLVADEVYRGIELGDAPRLAAAVESSERALSIGVLSKAHGLPGLRIGWVASKDRAVLDALARFKHYATICASAPSEVLAIMALRIGDRLIARNAGLARRHADLLAAFVERSDGRYALARPDGGTVAFPELRTGERIEPFCARLVHDHGLLLLPGTTFHWPGEHFRIGFGRADFGECLAVLERADGA